MTCPICGESEGCAHIDAATGRLKPLWVAIHWWVEPLSHWQFWLAFVLLSLIYHYLFGRK